MKGIIGLSVLAVGGKSSMVCDGWTFAPARMSSGDSTPYWVNVPDDLFPSLKACMDAGTGTAMGYCATTWGYSVQDLVNQASIDCASCLADFFISGPNVTEVTTCVNSCTSAPCPDPCDVSLYTLLFDQCNVASSTTTTTTEEETTTEVRSEDPTTASGAMAVAASVAVVGVLAVLL